MYEDLRVNDVPFVGPYRVINAKTKELIHEWPYEMCFDLALAKVKLIYAQDGILIIEVEWK